ncbi:MAG: hypothetical protein V4864_16070 [Pseudomonadota bacterium]
MKKATPTKAAVVANSGPRTHLQITRDESKTEHQQLAEISLSPIALGATAALPWAQKMMGVIGLNEGMAVIQERAAAAAAGDLDAAKAMLMAQAVTLDTVFNQMTRLAASCLHIKEDGTWTVKKEAMDDITRIAFKAQSQCRTTLQTLGELVNPRSVAFIKQANMANGPQQVNNGQSAVSACDSQNLTSTRAPAHAPAGNYSASSNKLLEANPSERMDFGAQGASSAANQILEAVGTVNRSKNTGGKVSRLSERRKARPA